MSKIGMKSVAVNKANVNLVGNTLSFSCNGKSISYSLPNDYAVTFEDKKITIRLASNLIGEDSQVNLKGAALKKVKTNWGLHRSSLFNMVQGIEEGFTSIVKIVGLGYKAAILPSGKVSMALGYSHKIEFDLDPAVTMEIDRSGQLLTLKSQDKFKLGEVCSYIRSLRPPEPYKGTGIYVNNEKINRKAGKSSKK